jgi:glycosyltransferase involved in cell wall biosynthesis
VTRVLVVTNMWPREDRPAFGAFVRAQVEALREIGLDIAVHVIEGDRGAGAYAGDVPVLRREVRRRRPDVVHAHYGLSGWTAAWQPAPLIVSFCGDDLLGTPAPGGGLTVRSRAGVAMSRWAARKAAAIICKSAGLAAALPRDEDRRRAHVIPNGVDASRFHPGDRAESRHRLGFDPGEELVLFPQDPRQALQKRFDLAEAAMAELRRRRPAARLLQVSGVPHAEMPDYYRAADCLLLTSRSEGSPNVVKEALASGLPVVSVDVGDVRAWVERSAGGLIAGDDPAELAGAMDLVLSSGTPVNPAPLLDELDQRAVARRVAAVYASVAGATR